MSLALRRLAVLGGEVMEVGADLVADLAEGGEAVFFGAGDGGGVREVVVEAVGVAGVDGAGLLGVVADGEDVVEGLVGELVDGFGAVAGKVDAKFGHDADGFRPDEGGSGPGAFDREDVAVVMTEEALGHLAAGGVRGAEDEDALVTHVGGEGVSCSSRGSSRRQAWWRGRRR